MPFYIFNSIHVPEYPATIDSPALDAPVQMTSKNEVSFAFSESFFQVPDSLSENVPFLVPETQFTPPCNSDNINQDQLMINVTANQSILLPSISSVLEGSARSALNHRRKSSGGHFPAPFHQRVADKLEMPSQNPNSPLFFGSKMAAAGDGTCAMDLTEDSLLLALDSSVIIYATEHETGKQKENINTNNNILQGTKFSLDFLNTPPINNNNASTSDANERISTQVLIQNLNGDTQITSIQDISLLSLDDRPAFDPLDLLPNTPNINVQYNNQILDSHDAIIFPDSFDESNNPFMATNPNDFLEKASPRAILDPVIEGRESSLSSTASSSSSPDAVKPNNHIISNNNNAFQARLMSSMSTSPGSLDFGPKRIVLSARKTSVPKPAPLSIKSSSVDSVALPETIKKSLGVRMKRVQFTKSNNPETTEVSMSSPAAAPVTPMKNLSETPEPVEEKYMNHILKTENKRISMIVAEPRRTPIAGIKQMGSSPALRSSKSSLTSSIAETPNKSTIPMKTPIKSSSLVKEASLASYYTDLVLSSPQLPSVCIDSPNSASNVPLDSASNLIFKTNQWVFFRNNSSFLVGSVCAKTSKTRDTWRVKQSNGTESTVSSLDMCPVAFLRPSDELFLRTKKSLDQIQLTGPFKFKKFGPQTVELYRESPKQLYDCLKLTRIAVEKDTFIKIRLRFEQGSLQDSQIRDQIMTLNFTESSSTSTESQQKRKKRTMNPSDSLVMTPPPVKRTKQNQIFLDMKFLITVGDNKEDASLKTKYSQLIESHGGELLVNLPTDHEIPVLKTFLLSNGFKRTSKFMTAIIRGVPRVHFNWIEACCNQSCFIDPSSFTNFLIEPPASCKPTGLLFKGKKFYPCGSAKFKNSWTSVLRLLGATVSINSNTNSNTICLAESSDDHQVKKNYEKVVNIDWLIKCIIERSFL